MSKKGFFIVVALGIVSFFCAAGLYAGTQVADIIELNDPIYPKHKKGIVKFSHKKHANDYGAKCGECHHDNNGKPLDLKMGDDVQKCSACHKEVGKIPKKIKKAERIKRFHKSALHENCKACHRDWNKKQGLKKSDPKAAPTTCKACHPSKKKQ